ncbi:hypothetical protein F9C28_03595, partial [Shimwellia pseudoproteus]|nr:hypothetical protein [Shimwellia pseudoproteus]
FELLLCHRMSLQGQECGDLILISAKSSIYSTKPVASTSAYSLSIIITLRWIRGKAFDELISKTKACQAAHISSLIGVKNVRVEPSLVRQCL